MHYVPIMFYCYRPSNIQDHPLTKSLAAAHKSRTSSVISKTKASTWDTDHKPRFVCIHRWYQISFVGEIGTLSLLCVLIFSCLPLPKVGQLPGTGHWPGSGGNRPYLFRDAVFHSSHYSHGGDLTKFDDKAQLIHEAVNVQSCLFIYFVYKPISLRLAVLLTECWTANQNSLSVA